MKCNHTSSQLRADPAKESNPSRPHRTPFVLTKKTRAYQLEGPNIVMKSTREGQKLGRNLASDLQERLCG